MRTEVKYEWSIETVDEHGDIVDCDFSDTLAAFKDEWPVPNVELALLRREGSESQGETDRLWAYIKDGKLPETFSDAWGAPVSVNVPKRFHKELEQFIKEPVS